MDLELDLSLDDLDLGEDNIIDTVLNELDDLESGNSVTELDTSDIINNSDETVQENISTTSSVDEMSGQLEELQGQTGFESVVVEEIIDEDTGEVKDYEVSSERDFWITTFAYQQNFLDATEMNKIIKAAEKLIRTSFEYSKYLGYLKNDIGMLNCAMMSNVTSDDKAVTVEMHHYPFTLYDLCEAVTNRQLKQGEQVTTFSIADEVLELHYKHLVGLVPLSKTAHELAHSGEIFINIRLCFGKIVEFATQYHEYIPDDKLRDLAKILDLSEKHDMRICSDKLFNISINDDYHVDVDENLIENLKLVVKN